ncbi:hypothetical protein F4809DRAFT_616309 [Biscogniauxia mediterranea]|nr:hypothetical protein F4809DRAFT_616309 [Biscogniauxia mediterranea]
MSGMRISMLLYIGVDIYISPFHLYLFIFPSSPCCSEIFSSLPPLLITSKQIYIITPIHVPNLVGNSGTIYIYIHTACAPGTPFSRWPTAWRFVRSFQIPT